MDDLDRPYRSVLYIPASNTRALDKAQSLEADAIIFDLEDAVAPDEKESARETLAACLRRADYGPRFRIVRINALDTKWGRQDAGCFAEGGVDAILLPKVNSADDMDELAAIVPALPLWAMMETPLGVLNAPEVAAHGRVSGFVMGTNDLAKELNCRPDPMRMPLMTSLQTCLLAARAHGVIAIDGVYNAFHDEEGLRRECRQGRDMGFDGKTLIHPAQLAIANELFSPEESEIELARRQIEAFEAAEREGRGVAVLDGRIVENLHVEAARRLLARAKAILTMKGDNT